MKFLIRGGCVLSLDSSVGNHRQADVLIEHGRIAEIGQNLRSRDAETVDASDCIVMPGFVDTHRHTWEALLRALGDLDAGDDPPARFLAHLSADDVYAATLVGLLGALEAGITTVVDWAEVPEDAIDAALQAHVDAGVRGVFVRGPVAGDPDSDAWRASIESLAGRTHGELTRLAAGAPGRLTDGANASADLEAARRAGHRVHVHVGTDEADRGRLADAAPLLGSDLTLVHCTHLDDSDFEVVAASGVGVSVCAAAEMSKGFDPPPMQRLLDRSIRPGLGVDTERLAPGDIFAPMRAAISLQHARYFDLKLAGKGGLPNLLNTREVIRYATTDGARAVGLAEVTGTLTPGKTADVIVLRADRPNIAPVNDPIGAVVWGMDTSNIDWVFVAGVPRLRSGHLDADIDRVRRLATEASSRVATSAGFGSGVRA